MFVGLNSAQKVMMSVTLKIVVLIFTHTQELPWTLIKNAPRFVAHTWNPSYLGCGAGRSWLEVSQGKKVSDTLFQKTSLAW
jgi:hypothetical protein